MSFREEALRTKAMIVGSAAASNEASPVAKEEKGVRKKDWRVAVATRAAARK